MYYKSSLIFYIREFDVHRDSTAVLLPSKEKQIILERNSIFKVTYQKVKEANCSCDKRRICENEYRYCLTL